VREADWLTIEDALAVMLEHVAPLPAETVPLDDALGRTLAEPIISPIDHPPWDNSAMDGYAVHAADVRGASAAAPVVLRVIEEVQAGAFPTRPVARGEATRLMTGAPVPPGTDTVVRIEHTRDAAPDSVAVVSDSDAGRNVRLRGEDVQAGESVFTAGRRLGPADIGLLAMVGCTRPLLHRRPRVALLATGDELVAADDVADVQAGTHIIDSNSPALAAALRASCCDPLPLGIARDELDDLRRRIGGALDADALITTAGASVGDHDLVKDALEQSGCRTLFWRVKVRPGSPFSFGLIERAGRTPLPVFGLPGNPVSVLVTFEVLVRPVLRRMHGRTALYPPTLAVELGEDAALPAGLVRFLRVRLDRSGAGPPRAYLTGPQGSGILSSVTAADALLIIPAAVAALSAGASARAVPLQCCDEAHDVPQFH
jgi:molybdopterin molybdotransferase